MSDGLVVGLRGESALTVTAALTVPAMADVHPSFASMPPVFATARMVAFIEWACIETINPHLGPGLDSVGTHIDVSHDAATPVGMRVWAAVELVAVEGRKLRFKIECRDERDVIARGHHERFIIDAAKFNARVAAKATSG